MRYILTIAFLLPLLSKAQITDPNHYSSMSKLKKGQSVVGANYNFHYGSTAINYSFLNKIIDNDPLNDNVINSANLSKSNYFGIFQNTGAYCAIRPHNLLKWENIGLRIGVADHHYINTRFTNDAYSLFFNGNSSFEGKTADISQSLLNQLHFQEIQLGFFTVSEAEDNIIYYGGISLLKGQNLQSAVIREGKIYTAESGEYIDADIQGMYYFSDTNNIEFQNFNGFGAALNFYVDYTSSDKKSRLTASLNHLGYIKWNEETTRIAVDTSIHFEGFVIEDMLSNDSIAVGEISMDSIMQEWIAKGERHKYIKVIPERVFLSYTRYYFDQDLELTLGMAGLFNANTKIPVFYSNIKYNYKELLSFWMQPSYGGYNPFQLGCGLELNVKNRIFLKIGSNSIIGLVASEKAYSAGIYSNLQIVF